MKLTSKGRYAVTAMLDVALNAEYHPVSLADISMRQEISLSYLEQIFARLRRNGLVSSSRGPGGGYRLARPVNEISIAMIIDAVDECVDITKCNGNSNCQGGKRCLSHVLWHALSQRISTFLNQITLADLITNEDVLQLADAFTETKLGAVPCTNPASGNDTLSI